MNNNKDLINALSRERLTKYLAECGDDEERAIRLYSWNTHISAMFYPPLHGLEIALRNAIHQQLQRDYGKKWYDSDFISEYGETEIEKTKTRLKGKSRGKVEITASDVISNMSLGFWVSLFDKNYEMFWRKSLHKIFQSDDSLGTKWAVYSKLKRLRELRNRIAHHEPIFRLDLEERLEFILQLTDAISPAMSAWVRQYDVSDILKEKPE